MLSAFLMIIKQLIPCGLVVILLCAGEGLGQDEFLFPKTSVSFKGDKSSYALPVKFEGDHVYVETYFGKQGPFYLLLDTGTSLSLMIPDLVSTLKLKSRNLHGDPRLAYVDVPLQFPGLEIKRQRFFSKLIDATSTPKGKGILGYDFIRQFVLEIDYPHGVVVLHNRRTFRKPEPDDGRWEIVPLTLARNCPQIPIQLRYLDKSTEQFQALIDTGDNRSSANFTPDVFNRVRPRQPFYFEIGRYRFQPSGGFDDQIPIYELNRPPFPYDLMLPAPLFRTARLLFDYENAKLYLRVE